MSKSGILINSGSPKLAFIVNPAARNHRAVMIFNSLLPLIREHIPDFKVYVAKYGDELLRSVSEAEQDGCTHIIACGGDGTVHQIANILALSDLAMGILPLGSGNDVAYSLDYPSDPVEVIQRLLNWNPKYIDLIKANETYVINTLGIGLDGFINDLAANRFYRFKTFRYVLSGVYALLNYKSRPFEILGDDGKQMNRQGWMICIANGKREGGRYLISPNSKPDDGVFELLLLKNVPRLQLMIEFLKLSVGLPFRDQIVKTLKTNKITIKNLTGCYVHADGEQVQYHGDLNAELIADALTVIRP